MRMCDRILSLHSACPTDGGFLSPAMAKEETFFQKPWHCEFPVECITFVPTLPGRVQVYTTCLEVMNSCRTTGSPEIMGPGTGGKFVLGRTEPLNREFRFYFNPFEMSCFTFTMLRGTLQSGKLKIALPKTNIAYSI